MFKSKLLLSTLAALGATGALLSAPVLAATDGMSIKQAYEAVEKAGYKEENITSIKTTRDGYKVNAFNAEDQRVRLLVNPKDSSVTVYEKRKDCDDSKGKGKDRGHRGKQQQNTN